jgi:hypothetical protein
MQALQQNGGSMSYSKLTLAAAAALLLSGCAAPMKFAGTLDGGQEVQPTRSAGTGTMNATVFPTTRAMTYTVEYTGLSGAATAAHFHGPAAPGANAGVVAPLATPTSPIKGSATLTKAQMADLMAGKWYANVHTAANPGGEIRGQMLPGVLPK